MGVTEPHRRQSGVFLWTLSGILLAACGGGGGGGGGGVQISDSDQIPPRRPEPPPQPPPPPSDRRATGTPLITHDGTPQLGETLTVDRRGIMDPDDPVPGFRYGWYNAAHEKVSTDDTSPAFMPVAAGEYYAKVSVIDNAFEPGTPRITELSSARVTVIDPGPARGTPVIAHDGTPQTTERLRADVAGIRDPDDISPRFRYEWFNAADEKVSTDDKTSIFTPAVAGTYYVRIRVIDDAANPAHPRTTVLTSARVTVTLDNGAPDFPAPSAVGETRRAGDVISYYLRATDPDDDDLIEFAFPDSGMIRSGDVTYSNGNIVTAAGYGIAATPVGTVIGTLALSGNTPATSPKTAGIVFTPNAAAFSNLALGESETFTIRIEARDDDPESPHTHQDVSFTVARYTPVQLRHSFSRVPDNSNTLTPENTVTTITLAEQAAGIDNQRSDPVENGWFRAFTPDGSLISGQGSFGKGGEGMVYVDVNGNGMLDTGVDTVHGRAPGSMFTWEHGFWRYHINPFETIGTGNDLLHVLPFTYRPNPGTEYAPPATDAMLTFIIKRGDGILDEGESLTINDLGGGATYTVSDLPENGRLLNGETVLAVGGTFTQADLDMDRVTYEHDGSETLLDSFSFTRDDNTLGTFDLVISGVNDLPVITGDLAATLDEGATYTLTAADVSATDEESGIGDFFYRITENPEHGMLKSGDRAARFFTMADITGGRITYEHDGSDTTADSFGFYLSDGTGRVEDEFVFTITPVDDL